MAQGFQSADWLNTISFNVQAPPEQGPAFDSEDWLNTIYVAYWGRAADPGGLDFWVDQWDEQDEEDRTKDAAWFASNFALSEEASEEYDYFAAFHAEEEITQEMREDFVDAIYQNLFNREPDAEGKDYWLNELETGAVDPGVFIATIVHSALVRNEEDAQTIMAKKDVAAAMTEDAREKGWTDEQQIIDYMRSEEAKNLIDETTPENVEEQKEAAADQLVIHRTDEEENDLDEINEETENGDNAADEQFEDTNALMGVNDLDQDHATEL